MITSRNILGMSVAPGMNRIMEANGFYASIMKSDKQDDKSSGLPPGTPIPVMPVDCLKERPDYWVGGVGSFCCPIESDWALWFNWTMNMSNIAVLSSVKGMNPITGQRINGLELEQYKEKCPIHGTKFKHGRFCEECNFKWPDQNYVSEPNPLYWDGFRTADGQVRQFYFTEDLAKSIPELVIGKEDTVPAFGFCFYTPKDAQNQEYEGGNRLKNKFPKNQRQTRSIGGGMVGMSGCGIPGVYTSSLDMSSSEPLIGRRKMSHRMPERKKKAYKSSSNVFYTSSIADGSMCLADSACLETKFDDSVKGSITAYNCSSVGMGMTSPDSMLEVNSRSINAEVGIGAGAKIKQGLVQDVRAVDSWQDKPAGIIRVYFVFREQFERYAQAGLKDLTGSKEGYLDSLPVGGAK